MTIPDFPGSCYTLTEDNVVEVAAWCGGKIVKEIDEKDPEILHSAVNFPGVRGVERAHIGDQLEYQIDLNAFVIINKD